MNHAALFFNNNKLNSTVAVYPLSCKIPASSPQERKVTNTKARCVKINQEKVRGTNGLLPDVRVEKQLHGAASSSVGCRASDWEQDSHRDREKWSAVTQAGLSRATTSRQSARKTQSSAMSLKGRNTYTSLTDIFSEQEAPPAARQSVRWARELEVRARLLPP